MSGIDIHDPSGFVRLADYVPDAIEDLRYATADNFVGAPIDGYDLPVALLTRRAAEAVREAAADFRAMGYAIVVYDAYRPQRATDHFLRWLKDPADTRMKSRFYPGLDKSQLIQEDYIGPRSGHSRGSAIDMSLARLSDGQALDMGGPFDFFGERSHADFSDGLTREQIDSRRLLREVMLAHGLVPLRSEWWHFRLAEEPYPDTCFDFPIDRETLDRLSPQINHKKPAPRD